MGLTKVSPFSILKINLGVKLPMEKTFIDMQSNIEKMMETNKEMQRLTNESTKLCYKMIAILKKWDKEGESK